MSGEKNRALIDEERRQASHQEVKASIDDDVNAQIKRESTQYEPKASAELAGVAHGLKQKSVNEAVGIERELSQGRTAARVSQVVDYLFYIIYGLIGLQFMLRLMGARPGSGFVRLVAAVSSPPLAPFERIVGTPSAGGFQLQLSYLLALVVYILLHLAVNGMFRQIRKRRRNMESQIRLGRVFGVEIGLHYSWLLIALLIVFSLTGHFGATHPDWGQSVIWGAAIVTAIFFFIAIVAHELSHALVARRRGLPVRSITLFALGGVAQLEKEAEDAKTEFLISVVGPVTSAAIGIVCLMGAWLLGWTMFLDPDTPLMSMLIWLGYINIGLAVFNMLPGFPMDGGRVLRAVIWWVTGSAQRATRAATAIGQFVALAFITFGILRFIGGGGLNGLWIAFIGWFLYSSAKGANAKLEMTERLRGVRVRDLMARDCLVVDGNSNLLTFVNEHLLHTGQRCFLVAQQGEMIGLITPNEVKGVSQARWPYTTVFDVMRPLERLRTVSSEITVTEALEIIGREDVNQLPVLENGRLEGMISHDQIMRYLLTRAELKM